MIFGLHNFHLKSEKYTKFITSEKRLFFHNILVIFELPFLWVIFMLVYSICQWRCRSRAGDDSWGNEVVWNLRPYVCRLLFSRLFFHSSCRHACSSNDSNTTTCSTNRTTRGLLTLCAVWIYVVSPLTYFTYLFIVVMLVADARSIHTLRRNFRFSESSGGGLGSVRNTRQYSVHRHKKLSKLFLS